MSRPLLTAAATGLAVVTLTAVVRLHAQSGPPSCDRACLNRVADAYVAAMLARDRVQDSGGRPGHRSDRRHPHAESRRAAAARAGG